MQCLGSCNGGEEAYGGQMRWRHQALVHAARYRWGRGTREDGIGIEGSILRGTVDGLSMLCCFS